MTVIKLISIFNATAFLAVLLKVFNKKGNLNSAPPRPIKPPKQPIGAPIANDKNDVFFIIHFINLWRKIGISSLIMYNTQYISFPLSFIHENFLFQGISKEQNLFWFL